jgi:hypothetical protein
MLIKSLMVEGIGRFASAVHIDGFGDGVNVLAAGNEIGKSTLFKAIRTCVYSRHDSKVQDIRDLGSDGSQLPATVHLTFVRGGRTYGIQKSFLRSPTATLTEDGREIARGKQADEAIWDILGLNPGSGRSVDDGAFGVLWVGQRGSFSAPVPGAGAMSMLNAAIESEVGALVGGERARKLLDALNLELRTYLTPTEQARSDGPLNLAIRNAEHWRTAEADAIQRMSALEQQISELYQCRRRHGDFTDPVMAEQAAQEIADSRRSLTEGLASIQELRRLEAEESAAKREIENAAQRLHQFKDVTERIDANRSTEATLSLELPKHTAKEHETRSLLLRTNEQIAVAVQEGQLLSTREQQIERLATASVRALRKADLTSQIGALEEAAIKLRDVDAQLSLLKVKPKAIDDLDDVDRQIASLDAQLSAAAARLDIQVSPAGKGAVRVGALTLTAGFSAAVIDPTEVTIGDLAIMTITPAATARHEQRETLAAERTAMLKSLGVVSSGDAQALLARKREYDASREGILAQLKAFKVDDDPATAIAVLKNALAQIDAAINEALIGAERSVLPTSGGLEQERALLEQERVSLDGRRANLDGISEVQQCAIESAVKVRSATETKLEFLQKAIADDTALCPDSERVARQSSLLDAVTAATATHQTAAAMLDAARRQTPDGAEIERRQSRVQRLEQAANNQKQDLMLLERDIGRLTGQIQTAGGDGIGETLAAANEQRELADRELERVQERVAALKLLRDTVAASLAEGRDRYHEPVRRHIRPFLNDLFPGAELELGEGFEVTGIRRNRSELFDRLSDGTQEQIAVLVRLAMGAMLAEKGAIVPVILDDALVYCDDDRIKLMFDALSRAGKQQQIIVLTCRLRAFGALGGNTLRVRAA